jgi:hypothetical protein
MLLYLLGCCTLTPQILFLEFYNEYIKTVADLHSCHMIIYRRHNFIRQLLTAGEEAWILIMKVLLFPTTI